MSAPPAVVFYGASGQAAAIRDIYALTAPPVVTVAAFIDDFRGDRGEAVDGVPVIGFETWRASYRDLPCFVTVGNPSARRMLAERVAAAGGTFCTLARADDDAFGPGVLGEGSLITSFATIGSATMIGRHVHVMVLASIDRGCTIGDYVTICPGATIHGRVVVHDEVFVGAGATIANERAGEPLTIGRGAKIHAGAVVTGDVPAGAVRVGNPATDPRSLVAGRTAR